jgi:hypothetical protein
MSINFPVPLNSIQERINRTSISRSRKLFERDIQRTGVTCAVIRTQRRRTSIRGDYEDLPVSSDQILLKIEWPPELPLNRARLAQNIFPPNAASAPVAPPPPTDTAAPTQIAFWDLLPIFAYAKWSDNLVKNDLIVYVFGDENGYPVPIILRVTEELAAFHSYLVWRKMQIAVEQSPLSQLEYSMIQAYLIGGPPADN